MAMHLNWPPVSGLIESVRKRVEIADLASKCVRKKALVLSYDDGPSRTLTPLLINLLGLHQVRGTFFVRGDKAADAPELIDEIISEGHEIGCHGFAHLHPWRISSWAAVNDIRNGYRSLEPWLSEKCLFRPPYGKLTRQTRLEIESRDAKIGWWTVDSGDTWPSRPTIDSIVTKVLASGGGVVLMHDFERMSDTAEAVHEYVLSLTEALITGARNQGLDIYGLSEVMDCDSSNR